MGTWSCLADLLEYPPPDLAVRLARCRQALGEGEAADAVRAFEAAAGRLGSARLEEDYTSAFDLDGSCALYAGHQLFGEDSRRNLLLCRLAAEYRQHSFPAAAGELPDYLPTLLRYADTAATPDEDADGTRRELLADLLLPAARKLEQALAARAHAYAPLLSALRVTLAAAAARAPAALAHPGGATA